MSSGTELAVYETFEDLFGRRSTLDELVDEISGFQLQSVLWVCAVIVTGLQLWNSIDAQPEVYARFLALFFDVGTRSRLLAGYWSTPPRRVFHRRQVLLIAKLAILHCSASGLDARRNTERFGPILLKASDQFHYGLLREADASRVADREDLAKIVAEMVAVGETGSPHIGQMITRNHLMLTRFADDLRSDPDFVDLVGEYEKATGLTVEEFEAMIFAVHARFGEELVQKLYNEPGALPLKEANFDTTAIPYEKVNRFLDSVLSGTAAIAAELRKRDEGPNDFTVFRKFPLVQQWYNMHLKTAWFGFLMMDNLFFLDKTQTGPYWHANALNPLKLRKCWGAVFERYVNELMQRACASTASRFLPDPRPADDSSVQLCDSILISDDAMVLIEYKSSMFRADTKYSGNHLALAKEIENKFVHDEQADERKGVEQLAHAAKQLFGTDAQTSLPGVDLKRIKKLYLYIVTLDTIGGTVGMSPFLDTFLQEQLQANDLTALRIRPLYCSDIAALEAAAAYFATQSLPDILERWFAENPSLAAPLSMIDIGGDNWQGNEWLAQEWNSIFKRMVAILFPDRNADAALAEAIRWARARTQ